MTDEIIDAVFEYSDGTTEKASKKSAAKDAGATFRSVFGTDIVNKARMQLSIWASRGWSERDQGAALPVALAASVFEHARKPEAEGLIGNPGEEQTEKDLREAKAFAQAYQRQTGVELIKPKQVSAHEELRMMSEAGEYAETGFCEYVEAAYAAELEYRYAERNRQDAKRKPVKQRGQKQIVL